MSDDADKLLDSIENAAPNEIPMSDPPEQQSAPDKYTFTANGKEVEATIEDMKKYASQGYNYSQHIESFKKQQQELDDKYKSYKEVDSYIEKNPQWWEAVQKAYNNRETPADLKQEGLSPEIQKTLNEVLKFKVDMEKEKEVREKARQDEALDKEIKSIRESFPDIDFSARGKDDEHTLEQKILTHAHNNGIPSFKSAFRDYMFDSMLQLAKEQGKESVQRELQKQNKLGLLYKSEAPNKSIQPAKDIKNKSYEDLFSEALDDIKNGRK